MSSTRLFLNDIRWAVRVGKVIHGSSKKSATLAAAPLGNKQQVALMNHLHREGHRDKALEVWDSIEHLDSGHWVARIRMARDASDALAVAEHAHRSGYHLNTRAYNAVLISCRDSADFGNIEAALQLMRRYAVAPSEHNWSVIIGAACSSANLQSLPVQRFASLYREMLAAGKGSPFSTRFLLMVAQNLVHARRAVAEGGGDGDGSGGGGCVNTRQALELFEMFEKEHKVAFARLPRVPSSGGGGDDDTVDGLGNLVRRLRAEEGNCVSALRLGRLLGVTRMELGLKEALAECRVRLHRASRLLSRRARE